jgi:hypothetical protein
MLITTLMVTRVHIALVLRLKNYGRTLVGIFKSMVWYLFLLPSDKYKIVSWKKIEFEALDGLLYSSRLYFVTVGSQLVHLYHVLYFTINICGIDCQKKHQEF